MAVAALLCQHKVRHQLQCNCQALAELTTRTSNAAQVTSHAQSARYPPSNFLHYSTQFRKKCTSGWLSGTSPVPKTLNFTLKMLLWTLFTRWSCCHTCYHRPAWNKKTNTAQPCILLAHGSSLLSFCSDLRSIPVWWAIFKHLSSS